MAGTQLHRGSSQANKTPIMIPGIGEDGALFPIEKLQAHTEAVFHLAVSVFVFDGRDLLIQRRAAGKYHCGGQWANTCCTHPHWSEPPADAAARRLQEELGFSLPLSEMRVVEYSADVGEGLHEHEKVTMFAGRTRRDQLTVRPNREEVSQTRWIAPETLRSEMADRPQDFTPWFRIYVARFPDLVF